MAAAALPDPATPVRPVGGAGRWRGSTRAGDAAPIAASNIARSRVRGVSIVIYAPPVAAFGVMSRVLPLVDRSDRGARLLRRLGRFPHRLLVLQLSHGILDMAREHPFRRALPVKRNLC